MEKESRKRARDQGEDKKETSEMSNTAKKQGLSSSSSSNTNGTSFEEDSFKTSSDNYLGLGVFDFPWLKEGMISKSEDWKFEDTFSSSLNTDNGVKFYGQNLCQSPVPLVDFPDDDNSDSNRFDHHAVGDGDEGVDCIWSSLLNQPLEPAVFNLS